MNNRHMRLGCTFSWRQASYLGLPADAAFEQLLSLREWSSIRLPIYWDDTEPQSARFDFERVQQQLARCDETGQQVVLTVGIKAPRWPEFHQPAFIQEPLESQELHNKVIRFISAVVSATRRHDCISHWQLENEPFDPSGAQNLSLPKSLIKNEVDVIRSRDSRPIMLTCWGNSLRPEAVKQCALHADCLGIDLYFAQFTRRLFGKNWYVGPDWEMPEIRRVLQAAAKPYWITEAQAEPWEEHETAYRSGETAGFSPQKVVDFLERCRELEAEQVLLWGSEYWLYRANQGDHRYLELVKDFS